MRIVEQVDGFRVDNGKDEGKVLYFKKERGWKKELVQEAIYGLEATAAEDLREAYERGYQEGRRLHTMKV